MIEFGSQFISTWPTPNYINPETRGRAAWIPLGLCLPIATFCVALRMFTRLHIRHWFGLDDALLLIGWLCTLGLCICISLGLALFDFDKHIWDTRLNSITPATKTTYVARIFWSLATSFVRLSVISLYFRLVKRSKPVNETTYRYVLYGMTFITVGFMLGCLVSTIFACWPIRSFWTWPVMKGQSCINEGMWWHATAIINTICEGMLACLPLIAVFDLHVNPKQRWIVLSIFGFGVITTAMDIIRTSFIWRAMQTHDITWYPLVGWLCAEIELSFALIAASIVSIQPYLARSHRVCRRFLCACVSRSKQSFSGTSQRNTLISTAADQRDEWNQLMTRAFDIEGISTPGYGYTVTISGPVKPKRPSLREKLSSFSRSQDGDLEDGSTSIQNNHRIKMDTIHEVDDVHKQDLPRLSQSEVSEQTMSWISKASVRDDKDRPVG